MQNNKTVQLGLVCKNNRSNDFELRGNKLDQPAENFSEVKIVSVTEAICIPEVIQVVIKEDESKLLINRIGSTTETNYKCKTEGTLTDVVTNLIKQLITAEAIYLNEVAAYEIINTIGENTATTINSLIQSMGYDLLAAYSPYSMVTTLNRSAHLAYILDRGCAIKLSLALNKEESGIDLFNNADESRKVDIHSKDSQKGLIKSSIF